ncbi:hypothetical protein M9H77_29758 [Catharanthus roseus]|uniref:Uncharacterized protein n=1 Tax=Catharanthus roseus TaxID=4058 RepID=A0ACB9ZVP1_CATRO|nr:hypothetical protein M9H77_29758 [Catharanthus roseus]
MTESLVTSVVKTMREADDSGSTSDLPSLQKGKHHTSRAINKINKNTRRQEISFHTFNKSGGKSKCVTSGIRALVEALTNTIKDQVAGSDTTNVESSQQGRGREEQRDPVIPKPRDQQVEGLEADIAETHEEVREALTKLGESNRVDLQALRDEFMTEVARLRDAHQRELNSLLMQLEEAFHWRGPSLM